jgi:hypothetical protein
MADQERPPELGDIELLVRRAGLELSEAELEGLVEPYRRTQAALRALRADLEATEEPALTFDPR